MERRDLVLPSCDYRELNPLVVGWESCAPAHTSQGIRNYFLIHYVLSGRGNFEKGGQSYTVSEGQIFLIGAGEWHRYSADEAEPWQYIWICFDGELAEDLRALPAVIDYPADTFRRLRRIEEYGELAPAYAAGCLFELYATLNAATRPPLAHGYASRARDYVDRLYMTGITVEGIAAQLSLDRRYLGRLFRDRYGMTLQAYLLETRMRNAARYIEQGYTAAESGRMVGYADSVNFYRMFKRQMGVGPAAWKKQHVARG